jgi:hypothetical protein
MDTNGYIQTDDLVSRQVYAESVNLRVKGYYDSFDAWTQNNPPTLSFPLSILRGEWDKAVTDDIQRNAPSGAWSDQVGAMVHHVDPVPDILEKCRQFSTLRYCAYYGIIHITGYQGSPAWGLSVSGENWAAFKHDPPSHYNFELGPYDSNDANNPDFGFSYNDWGDAVVTMGELSGTEASAIYFNLSADYPNNAGGGVTPYWELSHPNFLATTATYTLSGYNDFNREIIREIESVRSQRGTVSIYNFFCHAQCYVNCYGRCSHTWGSGAWFLNPLTFPIVQVTAAPLIFPAVLAFTGPLGPEINTIIFQQLTTPPIVYVPAQDYPDIPPPPSSGAKAPPTVPPPPPEEPPPW